MKLTPAQQTALDRARQHPGKRVFADPRTLRSLFDKGLVRIGHVAEGMDGPIYDAFLAEPEPRRYLCWCNGSACSNTTDVPFTVCAECAKFGHRPLPKDGRPPEDVEV